MKREVARFDFKAFGQAIKAARKAKGVTCVKDFIITYNYRVVPYIAIPVIMVLLILKNAVWTKSKEK